MWPRQGNLILRRLQLTLLPVGLQIITFPLLSLADAAYARVSVYIASTYCVFCFLSFINHQASYIPLKSEAITEASRVES
jgi:putative effector of murein hydrolase LrgA (UPF0299 family)